MRNPPSYRPIRWLSLVAAEGNFLVASTGYYYASLAAQT